MDSGSWQIIMHQLQHCLTVMAEMNHRAGEATESLTYIMYTYCIITIDLTYAGGYYR